VVFGPDPHPVHDRGRPATGTLSHGGAQCLPGIGQPLVQIDALLDEPFQLLSGSIIAESVNGFPG
jgi:hypothetical protein